MHHRLALLVGSLALATSIDAGAKCAMVEIAAKPIAPANTAIAPGGGILVGLTYDGRNRGDRNVEQPTWRIKQGGKSSEPKIKVLAPGLAVYEITGDGALLDAKGKTLVAVKGGKPLPALVTPTLKAAVSTTDDGENARWGSSSMLQIETGADAPAGVIGLIVYQAGKPMNWVVFEKAGARVATFRSGGHCSNDLPGTSVPLTGDLTVAWFDASGRVSPPSAALAVKLTKK
jgi:hypothetical protein